MKPSTKSSQESERNVQSLDERFDALREEVKSLQGRVKKLTKKTNLVCQVNAKLAASNSHMFAKLARFSTDLQRRRREVERLNSACSSFRRRKPGLLSSNPSSSSSSPSSRPSANTAVTTDLHLPSTEASTSRVMPLPSESTSAEASRTCSSIASPKQSPPLETLFMDDLRAESDFYRSLLEQAEEYQRNTNRTEIQRSNQRLEMMKDQMKKFKNK